MVRWAASMLVFTVHIQISFHPFPFHLSSFKNLFSLLNPFSKLVKFIYPSKLIFDLLARDSKRGWEEGGKSR